jgi:alcohol oxidase
MTTQSANRDAKLETVHLDDKFVNQSAHGSSGPVNITFGSHAPKGPLDDFMEAAQSYGFPEIGDLQDFEAVGGFNRSAKYIGPDGTRQDAAHRYVHPLLADGKHPNLHLLLQARVRRVLFEKTRAIGLEYEPEPVFLQEEASQAERIVKTVRAKRLVVVSAGALGTPSILERSGVGDEGLLSKLEIPVVSNLPGVGENYQDHHFLLCPYKTNLKEDETLDGLITGRRDPAKMFAEKDTFLTWNGIDIGGKLRMTDEQAASLGPKFEKVWKQDFSNSPTKPIMLLGVISAFLGDRGQLDEEAEGASQFVTMASYTPYPYSRGSIHITSGDARVPVKFLTGFLADEDGIDLKKQVWAYKVGRDIYRRANAFAGELATGHPKFPEGSKAALSKGPVLGRPFEGVEDRTKIAPIEYDDEDDRVIEQFIRSSVETTWHSLGTCKMAPREKGGVVDKDLNVYGTLALKCVGKCFSLHAICDFTNGIHKTFL